MRDRLTARDSVDMSAEGVKVELEVPGHRLEVASPDLDREVVRDDQGELGVSLVRALQVAVDRDVC